MAAVEQEHGTVLEFGPFCFDLDQGALSCEGHPIRLAPKEIETLRVLLENAGRLVSKEEIIATVWPDTFVSDDSLTRCVYVVRKALGEEQNGQRYIETLAKRGYRFVAPVSVRAGLSPAPRQVADLPPHGVARPARLQEPTDGARVVRFGVFDVDLNSGELRKNGLRIKLQEQPFQVLSMLLERPGEVVRQEDLHQRLWPADTFVDFEHGLNAAINKLREALADSAENPKFVETVPRRGYRFIYPVAASPPSPAVGAGLVPAQGHPQGASLRAHWRLPMAAGFTAALVAIIVAFNVANLRDRLFPLSPPLVKKVTQLTHDGFVKGDIMVTDGARIYFSEAIDGNWVPAVVSAAGGDTQTIPMPFESANVLDISPDGTELLVTSAEPSERAEPLWALPVLGGSPRRIGDIKATEATWSPGGGQILYTKDWRISPELFVANSDGTGSHKLATAPGSPYAIRWSPDGKRISLSVNDLKSNTLWEVSADGTNPHSVLPGWNLLGAACSGHWTPDGRYLLFDSYRDGPDSIWAIREKAGWLENTSLEPTRLTTGPMEMGKPVPSKDGKKVFALGTLASDELLRYDPKSRQFMPYLGGISAGHLDFSRDRQWITYVAYPEHTLWKSKVDGRERMQLTFPPIDPMVPRWAPDGKHIVFVDLGTGPSSSQSSGILLVSADGGNPEAVNPGPRRAYDPSWSPDGKLLAFGYKALPPEPASIHIYNLETHSVSKVAGSDGIYSPRWSPDGRYIAGLSSGGQNLMLFDFQTQSWAPLASDGFGWHMWSHDSRYVYFDNAKTGDWGVFRVRVADGKVERFLSLKGIDAPPSWEENYVGLAPDDSVFVLKNVVSREIYALDWEAP